MKLGKESLLAIIETALFVFGAIFFVLVLVIPSNPIWALIAGIVCGLAGVALWSSSLFIRLAQKLKVQKVNADDVAKQIIDDDNIKNGYELHRSNSYEETTDNNAPPEF